MEGPAAAFAGSEKCSNCHRIEFAAWRDSQHRLAMQPAAPDTVLGNFDNVDFDYFGSHTVFFRNNGDYLVRTENGNGEIEEFRITDTFGIEPLQQYLVEGPRGRKQALTIAWDSRPAAAGGQRWYHLYPDERIGPGDPLHWTGSYFTWNSACAECHSTGLEVGYDVGTDTFDTHYAEISVGCEACHGPGSRHIRQAERGAFGPQYGLAVDLDDRQNGTWRMNADTGIAELDTPGHRQQPESCGRCHSRRSPIAAQYEYGRPLTDTHLPALLDENLYRADGRILDEVYVYGSFLQSRMYAAGVTCSDCHDPHSARLRTGPEPNAVCSQCHLPARFATTGHGGVDAGDCVGCHMPSTTYMGIDDRRDHSFRIPGAGEQPMYYGRAIAAGRAGGANPQLLAAIANDGYPAIARATLLTLLDLPATDREMAAIQRSMADPDPLVRIGALRAVRNVPADVRGTAGSALLNDPVRGVRIEAAATLLDLHDLLTVEDARAFSHAVDEYRASLRMSAFQPGAAVRLAELESRLGNAAVAGRYYRHALRVGPRYAPGQHAYGLFLVRAGHRAEALEPLRLAASLAPENPRFAYVYGVALNSSGRTQEAQEVLRRAWRRFPSDFDVGYGLATVLRDAGELAEARTVAAALANHFPENRAAGDLVDTIGPGGGR